MILLIESGNDQALQAVQTAQILVGLGVRFANAGGLFCTADQVVRPNGSFRYAALLIGVIHLVQYEIVNGQCLLQLIHSGFQFLLAAGCQIVDSCIALLAIRPAGVRLINANIHNAAGQVNRIGQPIIPGIFHVEYFPNCHCFVSGQHIVIQIDAVDDVIAVNGCNVLFAVNKCFAGSKHTVIQSAHRFVIGKIITHQDLSCFFIIF